MTFRQFVGLYWRGLVAVKKVLLAIFALLIAGTWALAATEGYSVGSAFYMSLITGLTIGYGDIVPTTTAGRVVAVVLALVGLLFIGLVIAIAAYAVEEGLHPKREEDG